MGKCSFFKAGAKFFKDRQRSSIWGNNLSVCTVPPDRLSSQSWGIWLLKSCTRCWIAEEGQECFEVDGSWEGSTSGSSSFLILARQSLSSFSIKVLLYSPLGAGCFITSSIRCSTFAWSSTRIYLENILFISSGSWQVLVVVVCLQLHFVFWYLSKVQSKSVCVKCKYQLQNAITPFPDNLALFVHHTRMTSLRW